MRAATPVRYCLDHVRQGDPDRYWTLLLTRPVHRPALTALYAFNLELARIPDQISEPAMGAIRLQWWRETVDSLATPPVRSHPVAQALAETAAADQGWLRPMLHDLIDARAADIASDGPADFADVLAYADGTAGGLSEAAARLCGAEQPAARHAARQVGRAWALVGLIRAFGFHADVQRAHIPREALAQAGVNPVTVYRGTFDPALAPIFTAMTTAARDALDAARAQRAAVPRPARAPLSLSVLVDHYLARLTAAGGDPLQAKFNNGRLQSLLRLYWAGVNDRF